MVMYKHVAGVGSVKVSAEEEAVFTLRNKENADTRTEIEKARDLKLAALEAKRWGVETGGIDFMGMHVRTDRGTTAILTAAEVRAQADPTYTVNDWKLSTGVFVDLDATTIIAIAAAVEAHVQAAFTHEALLSGQILAATNEAELDAIDISAGW